MRYWTKESLNAALAPLSPIWRGAGFDKASGVSIDSRRLGAEDIFVALKGERFDGHDYIENLNAALAIVDRRFEQRLRGLASAPPLLFVDDCRLALGLLGKYRRAQCRDLRAVALTGSSGKTTTKEMLGNILRRLAPTLVTRGNLNNDLGVPLTLLELLPEHRFLAIELGANHLGEIAYTADLAAPDVACVLNVGAAHLGEFGGKANIAKAKSEIFLGLKPGGAAVLPLDDAYFSLLDTAAKTDRRFVFSAKAAPDAPDGPRGVFVKDVRLGERESRFCLAFWTPAGVEYAQARLPLLGAHNVANAAAAACCAYALGAPKEAIVAGLLDTRPQAGRLFPIAFGEHTLIDDTYNANPNSVLAAADVLQGQSGRKVLVLGDIAELGDAANAEHAKLGKALAAMDVDAILAVGAHSRSLVDAANAVLAGKATHFADKASLVARLRQILATKKCVVLFKGSRSAAMEEAIAALTK